MEQAKRSPTLRDDSSLKRAKSLPLGEAPMVPARMVNEVLYCERLMVLEWIQGEWASNAFTSDGVRVHKRVDAGGGKLASVDEEYQARSVELSSETLGVTAKLDYVEVRAGEVIAVEYKRGKHPNVPEGAYLPERAQLCAQVLLLREHGYVCDQAAIYFAAERKRVPITIDDELIATTRGAIDRAKELARVRTLPPPLVDSPKCGGCSLNGICLPDEINHLVSTPAAPGRHGSPVRRLQSAVDHRVPIYVTAQGARVGVSGKVLTVNTREETIEKGLPHIAHLALFGNVQMSAQVTRALLQSNVPIHHFTYGGWWVGATLGADSRNVQLRAAQYAAHQDRRTCSRLAATWVRTKILNSRTLLRRNLRQPQPQVLKELKHLAAKCEPDLPPESLLGIEGTAARLYFGALPKMFTKEKAGQGFTLEGRNRRPPRDRVNALLSLSYSLLTKDVLIAVRAAGLDPLIGFYHTAQFGRPSLALDLMEEFRPIIGDSVVISAINNGEVQEDDFVCAAGAVALSSAGRRAFIKCYERRLQQEVAHPIFGYTMSYRRVLEVQARLLSRVLLGELPEYPGFRTR